MHSFMPSGYSDYTLRLRLGHVYEDATDWLLRESWHSAISGNVFDPSAALRANSKERLYLRAAQVNKTLC